VVINCDAPGAWAFHCHILQHAEGPDGMFGMVTALVVKEANAASAPATTATTVSARAGAPNFECPIPGSL
jgi:hypothetical protein